MRVIGGGLGEQLRVWAQENSLLGVLEMTRGVLVKVPSES